VIKNYYVKESVGIACGLFIAALHNMGLATLTHTPSPMGFLSELLGRPDHERPAILFPIGYPAADARRPGAHPQTARRGRRLERSRRPPGTREVSSGRPRPDQSLALLPEL
jgi:nitroreductase